jgi:UDP-N-acetylglucosamine 2-epimerase (non-hydrolysing)
MPQALVVIGTRPEAIKLAPLIVEMKNEYCPLSPLVLLTGQHRAVVNEVLDWFEIKPDLQIDLNRESNSLSQLYFNIGIELGNQPFGKNRPDCCFVQGDTASAFVAAMYCFLEKTPVFHVEAGLRSHDLSEPFPEEFNRKLISQFCSLNFVPTETNRANLIREGIDPSLIKITGNTVVDAIRISQIKIAATSHSVDIGDFCTSSKLLILVTVHRRENQGDAFEAVLNGLRLCVEQLPRCHILFATHPSAELQDRVNKFLTNLPPEVSSKIEIVPPLSYPDMLCTIKNCNIILSDSGGLQEEAPSFGKPILILRNVTERTEILDCGLGRIVGTDSQNILSEVKKCADSLKTKISIRSNPFGDGMASKRIVDMAQRFLMK